jgi:CheY-like chemotaxis protein
MRTILIADEEEKIRHLVRFAFTEDMGYRVISASSGIDAAAMIKEFHPDVVICNVTLSGKDGYEISREIKSSENAKDNYVILLSNPNAFSDTRTKESHADEVILIPPDSTNIIGEIGERLETLFKPRRVNIGSPVILIPVTIILVSALSFLFYESSLMNIISGYFHLKNQDSKAGQIVISISEKGEVSAELVDKKKIQLEELEPVLSDLIRRGNFNNTDKSVVLRVNSGVPYELISQAIKIIEKTGVGKVNLTTETSLPFDLSQEVIEHDDVDSQSQISHDDTVENSTFAGEKRSISKSPSADLTSNIKSGDEEKVQNETKIDQIGKDLLNINVSSANIRGGPGMGYAIITRAQKGNTLYNLNQVHGSWIKVKTKDGVEGWISKNLLE